MDNQRAVECLIKSTISRAVVESAACVVVLLAFGSFLYSAQPGTAEFYGCLLILVSTGFVAGVLWSFTLSFRLLRTHPTSDSAFWREAFETQARFLRRVPLWYLAPLFSGLVLMIAPTSPERAATFLVLAPVLAAAFAAITWLNRRAAARIEEQARQMTA